MRDMTARPVGTTLRRQLSTALAAVNARLAGARPPAPDLRHGDTADQALASDEHDGLVLDLARLQRRRQLLLAALARLDADDYGICLDCQELIASARLLALPEVERCVRCQDHYERTAAMDGAVEHTELEAQED